MTATTATLTDFLLARIAEDEEVARDATNDGHKWLLEEETIGLWPDDLEPAAGFMHFPRKAHAYHAATWNPDRVLAECEAKRRIVEQVQELGLRDSPDAAGWYQGYAFASKEALAVLALPYADHPDYREEWRP